MDTEDKIVVGIVGVALFFVLGVFVLNVYAALQTDYVVATVIEKPVDEGNIYISVKFEDGSTEIFSNDDSLLRDKFNSRDFISRIEVGKTYEFKLNGIRIPFLSMHRNILGVTEISG